MKTIQFFLTVIVLVMSGTTAFSQKYKTAADTIKLNEKYIETSNDITELTSKLAIAQNNLPGYRAKANEASSDAQTTANESSEQANKATNGDLGDAKSAQKKAKKALNKAKGARNAENDVKDQNKKIAKLGAELQKKQEELMKLEEMRTTIRNMHQ